MEDNAPALPSSVTFSKSILVIPIQYTSPFQLVVIILTFNHICVYVVAQLTCQVKTSPRAFSDSSSLAVFGNEFLHNSNILGKRDLTTLFPNVMIAPIINHPEKTKRFNIDLSFLSLS